jgi:hypothetical protein
VDSNSKGIDNMAAKFEIKALNKKIKELEQKNYKLEQLIREHGLEDEAEVENTMSDEEYICVNEISNLKKLSENGQFTEQDAKVLDILYKNLRMIRGQSTDESKKKKHKKLNKAELFKIVERK